MKRASALLSTFLFALTACGGGSDGALPASPPASPPPPPSAMLVIDDTNAKEAVRVAYGASVDSMSSGDQVGGAGIAGTPGGGFQKPGAEQIMAGTLAKFAAKVPLGPDTYDCGIDPGFGTQTISGEIADPFSLLEGALSPGDQINVDFMNCDEGLGEVLNGRIEMTVVSFSGDLLVSAAYLMVMDVDLIDFEVSSNAGTILSNGDSRVTVDTTGTPLVAMSISGSTLTTVTTASTEVLTNFSTAQTVDTSVFPEPYTLTSSGNVDSTQLDGSIRYSTPVTFQGAGGAYPFAGELLVTGANNASVRLIALDATNVSIQTDADGDGNVDTTEDTTWDDIALAL